MAANKPGKEATCSIFLDEGNYSPLFLLTVPSAQRSAVPMAKAFMLFTRTGEPVGAADLIKPPAC